MRRCRPFFVAAMTLLCASAAALAEEPQSSVSILVDLSRTWHNAQDDALNRQALDAAVDASLELSHSYRAPMQVRVLPIGSDSLLQPPLCDAQYEPKLINTNKAVNNTFTSQKAFLRYIKNDCINFVLSRPIAALTDISGAIDGVARVASQQLGNDKALIILSDMQEELGRGKTAPQLSLPGFKVVVLYRVLPADRLNPLPLNTRLDLWKQRLTKAGASVTLIPDQGATGGQIARLLKN